ncbi:RNA guanine-N7 methyltransferase activating subunit [Anarrhichthys ocellatus]|uniref:RNA guanine-N7 methyltransferase activating subunit n=1 Tax=Anarrhichthys ocellatus TaxID=433405 RepID=UPI0012EDD9D1|nr:RNA guanine-N7 methyltransferase activating subunit [Anarrhichthys ocellatus]
MAETTDNQQKYEELFANRFSSDDKEYQQYRNRPADPPPIVENWRSRGGGNRGRDRYQDRRGRGWGGGRGWRGDQHGQQHWHDRDRDRDRDRHSGQGSGYQSGPPGYNQGYKSHQRPQYDRY